MGTFNSEDAELLRKIEFGLKLAIDRLYDQKAANNELAVVCRDGKVMWIDAKEVVAARKNKQ